MRGLLGRTLATSSWGASATGGVWSPTPPSAPTPASTSTPIWRGFEVRHGEELVTVRVRFSPYQSRWIRERRYHPSQQIEELADGALILTLRVAGIQEIKRWILGYGAHAEVLEPASLRAAIVEEAKKVAEIYRE